MEEFVCLSHNGGQKYVTSIVRSAISPLAGFTKNSLDLEKLRKGHHSVAMEALMETNPILP